MNRHKSFQLFIQSSGRVTISSQMVTLFRHPSSFRQISSQILSLIPVLLFERATSSGRIPIQRSEINGQRSYCLRLASNPFQIFVHSSLIVPKHLVLLRYIYFEMLCHCSKVPDRLNEFLLKQVQSVHLLSFRLSSACNLVPLFVDTSLFVVTM